MMVMMIIIIIIIIVVVVAAAVVVVVVEFREPLKILDFDIHYTKPQEPTYLHVEFSALKSDK